MSWNLHKKQQVDLKIPSPNSVSPNLKKHHICQLLTATFTDSKSKNFQINQ